MKTQVSLAIAALAAQAGIAAAIPAATEYSEYASGTVQARQATPSGSLQGYSLAYDPNIIGGCRDFDADFALFSQQGVGLIRLFDVGCDLGAATAAATKHNIKLMLGVNTLEKATQDLQTLITKVNGDWTPVDTVYICNECVERGAAPAAISSLVSTSKGVLKQAGYTGKVITVDTFGKVKDNPSICSTSDYCGVNIHPFFNAQFTSAQAGKFVKDSLADTQATNPNTKLVITETGWPHAGQPNGLAVPSSQDQKTALASIMSTFTATAADVYLFQPFDANYKSPGAFGVEPFFGILNEGTGTLAA